MSSVQQAALRKSHSHSRVQMRYSHTRTLTGIVAVKSRLGDVKSRLDRVKSRLGRVHRRLLRLEDGVLSVFSVSDDRSAPLMVVRVSSAPSVTVDEKRRLIHLCVSRESRVSFSFRFDLRAFDEWAAALLHADTLRMELHYNSLGEIGRGANAIVYEAIDRDTGEKVAIKVISKKGPNGKARQKAMQYIRREAEIVRMVEHPNIVRTLDVFEDDDNLYIVMEFAEQGNLIKFLSEKKNLIKMMSEHNAKCLAQQLVSALAYLHEMNVIHRDIKPWNILVFADGSFKLADFGLARVLDGATSDECCFSNIVGTPGFYPPEMLFKTKFGKPVDMYSCGVLLYFALSATLPFKKVKYADFVPDVFKGGVQFPPMPWAMISDDAKAFVKSLLAVNSKDRPTAHEAFHHPWLGLIGQLPGPTLLTPAAPLQRNLSTKSEAASGGNLTRFWSMVGRNSRSCRVNAGKAFCRAPSDILEELE